MNLPKNQPVSIQLREMQYEKRVFEWDVLRCECGSRMRILCAINPPDAIRKILDCLGLPSRPPPVSPAVEEPIFDF
jgi:hypothetical protein